MRRALAASASALVVAGLAVELGRRIVVDRADRALARLVAPDELTHRATEWDPLGGRLVFRGLRIAAPQETATIDRLVLHPTLATLLGRGGDLGRVDADGVAIERPVPIVTKQTLTMRYEGSFVIPSLRRGQARSDVSIGAWYAHWKAAGASWTASCAGTRLVVRDLWSGDPGARAPMDLTDLTARIVSSDARDLAIGNTRASMKISRMVAVVPDARHESIALSDIRLPDLTGGTSTGSIDVDVSGSGAYDPRAQTLAIDDVTLDVRGEFFMFADVTLGDYRPPSRPDDDKAWLATALTATILRGEMLIRDEGVVDRILQYVAGVTGKSVGEVAARLTGPAFAARHRVLASAFGTLRREGAVRVVMRPQGAVSIHALAGVLQAMRQAGAGDPMFTPDLGITVNGPSGGR